MVLEIHLYLQPPPPTSFQRRETETEKKRIKKKNHINLAVHTPTKTAGLPHAVWRAVNEITFLCLQNTHYYHELRELCH